MAKDTLNTNTFSISNADLTRADVQMGKIYRNNNKIWIYEVKDGDRWIPAVTQIFRTRKDARSSVATLRSAGLDIRIAKYAVTGFDRF